MKSKLSSHIAATTLFSALAIPVGLAAQEHLRYKLIDLGTLGGPQSFGANINNRGMAVGFADTTTPDPNYPNLNPGFLQDPVSGFSRTAAETTITSSPAR
jgi:hypothetical protein